VERVLQGRELGSNVLNRCEHFEPVRTSVGVCFESLGWGGPRRAVPRSQGTHDIFMIERMRDSLGRAGVRMPVS